MTKIVLARLKKKIIRARQEEKFTRQPNKCTGMTSVEWLARVTVLSRGVACPVSRRKRSATDTGQFYTVHCSVTNRASRCEDIAR